MIEFTDYQLMIFEKENIECGDVEALLGDLHDDELPEVLKFRLEDHIESCPHCIQLRNDYEMTISLAKTLSDLEEIPEDVHSRLIASLNLRLGLELNK